MAEINEELVADPVEIDEFFRGLVSEKLISAEEAQNLSAVVGCLEFISSNVAGLPIRIYKKEDGDIQVVDDYRTKLLNRETGDLLDAYQWKKRIVMDYLLYGSGYTYIDKVGNEIRSLRYVESRSVSVLKNKDPIFKSAAFYIGSRTAYDFQVMRILRNTKDGCKGIGVVDQANKPLSIMIDGLLYERSLFRSGARKGFLKTAKRLSDSALKTLTKAVKRLFSNSEDNVVVLNSGIEYQPAGQTAVETQLNEMKKTNSKEVCKIFCIAPSILEGGATEEDRRNSIINAVFPVVDVLESALNRFCLLESEKKSMFIEIDRDELLEVSQLERYQTYEIGKRNGWLKVDEIRQKETLPPIGFEYINIGLDSVLYDPGTKKIFVPNTGAEADLKGGDVNANGSQTE